MPSSSLDVIVLGAGMVGVSAALHLQARGRSVVVVDRLGAIAAETSYGNAGIVQSEAIFPYVFPRAPAEVLRGAFNRDLRAQIRYRALPTIGPALWRYFLASTRARRQATADAMAPFIARAAAEKGASRRRWRGGEHLRGAVSRPRRRFAQRGALG